MANISTKIINEIIYSLPSVILQYPFHAVFEKMKIDKELPKDISDKITNFNNLLNGVSKRELWEYVLKSAQEEYRDFYGIDEAIFNKKGAILQEKLESEFGNEVFSEVALIIIMIIEPSNMLSALKNSLFKKFDLIEENYKPYYESLNKFYNNTKKSIVIMENCFQADIEKLKRDIKEEEKFKKMACYYWYILNIFNENKLVKGEIIFDENEINTIRKEVYDSCINNKDNRQSFEIIYNFLECIKQSDLKVKHRRYEFLKKIQILLLVNYFQSKEIDKGKSCYLTGLIIDHYLDPEDKSVEWDEYSNFYEIPLQGRVRKAYDSFINEIIEGTELSKSLLEEHIRKSYDILFKNLIFGEM